MSKFTKAKTDKKFPRIREHAPVIAALLDALYEKPGFMPGEYQIRRAFKNDANTAWRDLRGCEAVIYKALAAGVLDDLNTALSNPRISRGRWQYDADAVRWRYVAGQYYCAEYRHAAKYMLRDALADILAANDTDGRD